MGQFDVVIAGASVAGCTAATLFARQGARVALLESKSDLTAYKTLCTTYIQPAALPVMTEIGLADELDKVGAVRNLPTWWTGWGWISPQPATAGEILPYGYNVRRQTMDPLVRRIAAETPGVELYLGTAIDELVLDGQVVTGVRAGGRTFQAPLVVGADGRKSTVARLARTPTKTGTNNRFSYFAQFDDVPLAGNKSVGWFLEPDVAYAMPHDAGVTVIAIIPHKAKLDEFRAAPEASFRAFVRALPDAPSIDDGRLRGRVIPALDTPNVRRSAAGPGYALIGDAALTSDPLWGTGCAWAFLSAKWLVEATAAALGDGPRLRTALVHYRRRHRRQLRGHDHLICDYASGRPFNPIERLMFSAAARDDQTARHMHAFASRVIDAHTFLSPAALSRALVVNAAYGLHSRPHQHDQVPTTLPAGTLALNDKEKIHG